MKQATRQMRLGLFVQSAGHHIAGWRYPEARSGGENLELMAELILTAERGKFDMFFLGDGLATSADTHPSVITRFEPLTLLSALAMITGKIGLAATASTTYGDPFSIARVFASLDHLSGGRAAWNVVTSYSDSTALNFGKEAHMPHELRYERAQEFVDVVKGLWDSWEDDAFIRNQETGQYIDKTKLHTLNHQGKHFSVKGPLNVSRTPQGHPVIIQAGSSADGQQLAAQEAEVVFTAQQSLAEAQAFYSGLKAAAAGNGRLPEHLLIMPGVMPIIGDTEREAQEKLEYLQSRVDPAVALHVLSARLGHDLSGYSLDGPLPELPETEGAKSRAKLLTDLARSRNLTLRQLYDIVAASRGHLLLTGTPVQIADRLEEWFTARGADGFNIMPPYLVGGIANFVDKVVPHLQERGLFRTEYEGNTLRERLGLPVPVNRYSAVSFGEVGLNV